MKKVIKSISIKDAKKDMLLATPVRNKNGEILFSKDHKLTYSCISIIRDAGISVLYIYEIVKEQDLFIKKNQKTLNDRSNEIKSSIDSIIEDNQLADNIDQNEDVRYSTPAESISKPPMKDVISLEVRKKGEAIVKDLFSNPNSFQYGKAIDFVSTIVEDILETDETVVSINDLRSYDNYTYQHSVNLCVLGATIGKFLNYDSQKLKEFGLGLLFHDFGKIKIPLDILNKPGRLTVREFEIMKNHAEYGHQMLSKRYKLPEITKLTIRHHHEKLDGSGYPLGLKGNEIPECVQIATVIDIYDALTADRIYKTHWTHSKAIEFLYERSDKWFKADYIRLIHNTVPERKESFSLLEF